MGCSEEEIENMNAGRIASFFSTRSTPWYLAGGTIPDSTNYTVYDPLTASDLASSYSNISNPGTRDAVVGVAPGFSAGSGWSFDGTSQYLDTGVQDTSANETWVIWVENWAGVYAMGSNKLLVRPYLSGTPNVSRLTYTTNTDLYGATTCGVLILRAGQVVYRNGVKLTGKNMGSYPAGTNYNVFLGCRNSSGSPLQYGSGNIYRFAHYDFALSDAQCEALFTSMMADVQPAASAYESVMIASNPVAYFPMNHNYGTFLVDQVGNGSACGVGVSCGYNGPTGKGKSFKGAGGSTYINQLDNWLNTIGFNYDEFSFSMWINNHNADTQARPFNGWNNGSSEYFAPEIRSGNIAIYSLENGTSCNTGTITQPPNDTWCHFVAYNSKSTLRNGIYVNGTKYDYAKCASGFLNGIPSNGYPYVLQSMTGYMCHLAFYDHALSQSEVNAIYQ